MHIQLTPDNSNPRQLEPKSISPGFPSYIYCHFTLGNLNFPLTRSNFFPLSSFLHNFTLDNSNHVNKCVKSREKTVHWSPKHWIYFKITKSILCLYFLSLQFKFSVHPIYCCLIAFPPHPFAYFLTSGYLLQTPDNSNFFQFPFKVRVIGSRL